MNIFFLFRWESFRASALGRQSEIIESLLHIQRNELAKVKEWMTITEDKISR